KKLPIVRKNQSNSGEASFRYGSMRSLQIDAGTDGGADRSGYQRLQRDHSREQGSGDGGLLGGVVRSVQDGGSKCRADGAGSGGKGYCREGGYGAAPRTGGTVQGARHSELCSVRGRRVAVPAGGAGGCGDNEGLAGTNVVFESLMKLELREELYLAAKGT